MGYLWALIAWCGLGQAYGLGRACELGVRRGKSRGESGVCILGWLAMWGWWVGVWGGALVIGVLLGRQPAWHAEGEGAGGVPVTPMGVVVWCTVTTVKVLDW